MEELLIDTVLVEEHRRWLGSFQPQRLSNWERILEADGEAAMCEAAVRRLLEANENTVEPNETLDGSAPAPDFLCSSGDKQFYVEVTCLSIKKVTQCTGLSHHPKGACSYSLLNDAIFNACKSKTPQCAGLRHPSLVTVGTFHFDASCLCFLDMELAQLLTGKEMITASIDTRTGAQVGETHMSTRLRSAAFLRPDPSEGMDHARNPVSGMLLCGFGCEPPEVRGILHPSPVHDFDRSLMPRVEFCRLKAGYESGTLSTEWI